MALATLIVAVLALTVATGTFVLQRRATVGQEASDSSLRDLLAIEQRRAERDEAEERAAAERQAAEERDSLVAKLHVHSPAPTTSHEPRRIAVANLGPHAAVLRSLTAQASVMRCKPDLSAAGVELEVGEERELPLMGLAAGPATIDLEWTDGRTDTQRTSIEVDLPPRPPWRVGRTVPSR